MVNADRGPRDLERLLGQMTDDLHRRGPDDSGTWRAPDGHLALGFRRLAVIDPGPAGAQPMWTRDRKAVIVFNGEIYNHRDLGRELEQRGIRFRSTSDTEVLVEGLLHWGTDLLPRLRGMFAFAFHRPDRATTLLARDHAGIKPLFLARQPGGPGVAFSSRYDSLFRTGWLDVDDIDPTALAAYMELKAVPAPAALHRNAGQLEPGQVVEIDPDGLGSPTAWWSLPEPSRDGLRDDEAVDAVSEAVDRAVKRHLVSDVPVGVFLSGGLDSPAVAGTAARHSSGPIDAFTIAYPQWDLDEGPEARRLGSAMGITPTVRAVDEPPVDVLDQVAEAQDEPVIDWSIIPTLLVSELARESVTVALSGDGGDEVFLGYERPKAVAGQPRWWGLPLLARRAGYVAGRQLGRPLSGALLHADPGTYYRSVHGTAPLDDLCRVAPDLRPHLPSGDRYDQGPTTDLVALATFAQRVEFTTQLQRVLRKVDMASMHHSLEVRVPLLDIDVINAGARLDPAWSLGPAAPKPALRAMLRRLGADSSTRKLGFGAPIAAWMGGPLRGAIDDQLHDSPQPEGWLDAAAVLACWDDQVGGRADHRRLIWGVVALDRWMRRARALTP